MPQFPDWGQQVRAWTDEAASRPAQFRDAIVEFVQDARRRIEDVPGAAVAELRQRLNVFDLATRDDIESVHRSDVARGSALLNEFLEAQRQRDEQLRAALRAEIQGELERFVNPGDDDLFAGIEVSLPIVAARPPRRRTLRDFDDDDDLDDDDLDDEDLDDGFSLLDEDDDDPYSDDDSSRGSVRSDL
jgi:hypothetical protein